MTNGNFQKCLDFESKMMPLADQYYKSAYPGCTIFRPKYQNGGDEKLLQQQDVDVILTDANKNKIYISEKFRSYDFGDILIEIYKDYDQRKLGWGFETKPDLTITFVLDKMSKSLIIREIPTTEINRVAKNELEHAIDVFQNIYPHKKQFKRVDQIEYRMIGSNRDKNTWISANICVPITYFKDSKQKFMKINHKNIDELCS